MRRNLRAYLIVWMVVMAVAPLFNMVHRGPGVVLQHAFSGTAGLTEGLYNLDELAMLWARVTYTWGISTDPPQAIIGREGWLYLGDQYRSTITVTRKGLTPHDLQEGREIAAAMTAWDRWLGRQGVAGFRIMIGPNKDAVYPAGVPAWATAREPRRIEALTTGPAGALYVDLRPGLRRQALREPEPLYYRTDSHWNALGAAHATRIFGAALRDVDPALVWPTDDGIDFVRGEDRVGGDLARILRVEQVLRDREPVIHLPRAAPSTSTVFGWDTRDVIQSGSDLIVNHPKKIVQVKTPHALNRRKVVWVRDSFGSALSPFMASTFDEVVQLHYDVAFANQGEQLAAIVRTWRPQLVVVTVVERAAFSEMFRVSPPGD